MKEVKSVKKFNSRQNDDSKFSRRQYIRAVIDGVMPIVTMYGLMLRCDGGSLRRYVHLPYLDISQCLKFQVLKTNKVPNSANSIGVTTTCTTYLYVSGSFLI